MLMNFPIIINNNQSSIHTITWTDVVDLISYSNKLPPIIEIIIIRLVFNLHAILLNHLHRKILRYEDYAYHFYFSLTKLAKVSDTLYTDFLHIHVINRNFFFVQKF